MPKSYAAQVQLVGSTVWCDNALRFETYQEAEANAKHLAARWTLVREWRVVESEDEPKHSYIDGVLHRIKD